MAANTGKALTMESRILQSEQVLRAKQEQIRKFIEANYGQILDRQKEIQQVEAELAALQMEAKQTVNPRKQALEFLRKKIEQQGERTSQAKAKEIQAKKAYEDAVQIARAEEQEKEKLSKELQALVQETASSQLERLEQLTRRLELLSGGAHSLLQPSSHDGGKSLETHEAKLPPNPSEKSTAVPTESRKGRGTSSHNGSNHVLDQVITRDTGRHANSLETGVEHPVSNSDTSDGDPANKHSKNLKGQPRLLNVRSAQASRGGKSTATLVKSRRNVEADANSKSEWTGDGFDVR